MVKKLNYYAIVLLLVTCNNKPPVITTSLSIIDCPYEYDQNSADSMVVTLEVYPIDGTYYVWFKGKCGPDSFRSNYAVQVNQSSCAETICVKWQSEFKIPTAWYKITGYMDLGCFAENPEYRSGESPWTSIFDVYDTILIAYTGCDRSARLDDRLNDTVAFKIRARLTDAIGGGINNRTISFETNKGMFVENNSTFYSTVTTTISNFLGIAEATLKLTASSAGTGGKDYDYNIRTRYQNINQNFTLIRKHSERCIIDDELSNIGNNYTHKRLDINDPGSEISGDNLPNTSSEDPTSNKKDVSIEIEYTSLSFENPVQRTFIDSICYYAKIALERGKFPGGSEFSSSGITVHFFIDSAITPRRIADIDTIRGYLRETRDSLRFLHCIIGNKCYDENGDTLYGGITIGRSYRKNNMPYKDRIFLAGVWSSNEVFGYDCLDSMGCFVALDVIKDRCIAAGYLQTARVVGVALAHEIGHAIGLEHTPSTDPDNIMTETIVVGSQWNFDNWGYFRLNRLSDSNPTQKYIFALDLLNKVGVETVSVGDHAFDR